ncbi:hypothetical protein K7432_014450 [Basidiobolus ranarum]|uniref:3-oxo-5-alpha-steroid 4-dehydrogenase C-terminal domain-containing protein n=1 Tax=Basidiobolus ranarum TaxID=34480 RepID=A0ABR2VQ08_9FUNG
MEFLSFANHTHYDVQDPEVLLLNRVVYFYVLFPVIAIVFSCVFTSPYGMLANNVPLGTVPGKLGWMIMEAVSPIVYLLSFFVTSSTQSPQPTLTSYIFLGLWLTHYINRSFITVWRSPYRSPIPVIPFLSGIFFNIGNGYMNGRWVGVFGYYPKSHLLSGHFLLGVSIFLLGLIGNIQSDNILMKLRSNYHVDKEKNKYKIPYGLYFNYLSCPHYFFEILEWSGYAIATNSIPAFLFALCTASNLIPRAIQIHQWYKTTFIQYPTSRKAIIPLIL